MQAYCSQAKYQQYNRTRSIKKKLTAQDAVHTVQQMKLYLILTKNLILMHSHSLSFCYAGIENNLKVDGFTSRLIIIVKETTFFQSVQTVPEITDKKE